MLKHKDPVIEDRLPERFQKISSTKKNVEQS